MADNLNMGGLSLEDKSKPHRPAPSGRAYIPPHLRAKMNAQPMAPPVG